MNSSNTILVVDDNPTNVAIIEEILEDEYEIVTADSGEQALHILETLVPDLVLLDIMMPGINGYDTCRKIRNDPRLALVKVILVSAKAMPEERMEGYSSGADDYMTKPFEIDELTAKVRVYLRLKRVEELDRLKTDVLRLLNLEIRTPLTGVQAALDYLDAGLGGRDPEAREAIVLANRSVERMRLFLENASFLGELKANLRTPECGQVAARGFLEDVLFDYLDSAQRARIDLRCDLADQFYGDAELLSVAVSALLEYAIERSAEGDPISATLSGSGHEFEITVEFGGPSFPSSMRHRIRTGGFAEGEERTERGSVLGLAICFEIVRLHNGKMELSPESEAGSRVTLRLPLSRHCAGQDAEPSITL